jgi:S1-C subfamily serine protease
MSRFWRHFISNGADSGQNLNYFTPEPTEREALDAYSVQQGRVVHGYLGLHARNAPLAPALARRYELTGTGGVEVLSVQKNGPADQAGLQEEDIIVALDEQTTANVDDLHKLLTTLPVGVPATVTLLRGERRLERMVAPTEYPNPAPRM